MDLTFKFSAIGLFRDLSSARTELRVILVDSTDLNTALVLAEELMNAYARDMEMEYCGTTNVFEAGSDMVGEYGEIFSLTWVSDPVVDDRLIQIIGGNAQ